MDTGDITRGTGGYIDIMTLTPRIRDKQPACDISLQREEQQRGLTNTSFQETTDQLINNWYFIH